ncbi:MAG: hypothetical protein K6A43_05990, partial [Treponema sp.]|nr:hypothetical protein [Treponema sp.]
MYSMIKKKFKSGGYKIFCNAKCVNLFLIILLCLLVSCKTTYNLQNEKNAADLIFEDLRSKKIVFIGENHSTVFPILWMTENMEKLYDAGMRYLFLEEDGDGYLPDCDYENYKMQIVPPWCTYGWKYEQHLMQKEIGRVNALHKDDPIKVIFPEEGVVYPEDYNDGTKVLNARDLQAQKTIIKIMDESKPEDKAVMFYGSGHGNKNPDHPYNQDELWYPSGYYLNNHYGSQYSSYIIYNLRNDDYTKANYGDSDFKVLSGKYLTDEFSPEFLTGYDYFCVTDKRIYGIIYPYVINEHNLRALYDLVEKYQDTDMNEVVQWDKFSWGLAVSYLKYCFGDYFPFSFEKQNISEALDYLNENVFMSGKSAVSFCKVSWAASYKEDMAEFEKYAEYLFSYRWHEDYIYGWLDEKWQKKACGYIIYNMNHAIEMNPDAPWPRYWLAYFLTERAKFSGRKTDYKKALTAWNNFFENQASVACPSLQFAYERTALCYSKLGNDEEKDFYLQKA